MRKTLYSPTAIAVTLLLVASGLAMAGERDLQQTQSATPVVQTANAAEVAEATALRTARQLVAAARGADNSQVAIYHLNQVFGLDLPPSAKVLTMAHTMMADLVDSPEERARHQQLAEMYKAARAEMIRSGARSDVASAKPRTSISQASTILTLARIASTEAEARLWLQRALEMDLPANDPQTRELLYTAHITMAGAYDASSKRAYHLAQAGQYVKNPAERARLEAEIEALGGAPVIPGAGSPEAALIPGLADNCFEGTAVPTFTATGESYSDVLSISAAGDNDWYTLEVDTGIPALGVAMRIETISDNPADPLEDDTRIWLYTDCNNATGNGIDLIEFDDDSGGGFMSRIDSQCLANGTYYLRVNGWEEVSLAENITLEIETTSECEVVVPDPLEADDDRASANELTDGSGQTKSIADAGDQDWNWFDLGGNRLVRISTSGAGINTAMGLFYASNNSPAAGLCNNTGDPGIPAGNVSTGIDNGCNVDADCPDNINPVAALPDCLPWAVFNPANVLVDPVDNALASSTGGPSELVLCLPRTASPSDSSSVEADPADPFHWFVQTTGATPDQTFNYEILLEDLGPCDYESEGNDDFASANDLPAGGTVNGIFDYSATTPKGDDDFYKFDIAERGVFGIATDGYDPGAVDTFIELWVGPDDAGDYFLVGANDDGGPGLLSYLELPLVPAADSLPNSTAATAYYINSTSAFVTPNFPYTLSAGILDGVIAEFEDFEDCGSEAAGFISAPGRGLAAIDLPGTCDYDGFRFKLEADRDLTIITDSVGDTTVQLVDCNTEEVLGCDDDGNAGCASSYCSQLSGCLPGGRDYCVRVRPFSGGSVFDYEIDIQDNGDCIAEDPPVVAADGNNACGDPSGGAFNDALGCLSDYVYVECAEEPLLVTMESMYATQIAEGVLISWTTAAEVNTVGFRVLREDLGSRGKAGRLVPISHMIPAAGSTAEGFTYTFIDSQRRGARSVNYYIQDQDAFGKLTLHGPMTFVRGELVRQAER